jgi:hypothetical protein
MNALLSHDLFDTSRPLAVDRPGVRVEEAKARMVRARNAALQKPLAYLDNSRNLFSQDDQKLFEKINPIQVAQYFLEKISDSMIFGQIVPRSDIEEQVKLYAEKLDFERVLSDEQLTTVVRKIVSALLNEQDNNKKFKEIIRNDHTLEEEEFAFRLLEIQNSRAGGQDVYHYVLTQHGVKLLHITWQAPDDFDMYSVMIEGSIRSGKYYEAATHIDQCLRSSTRIEAALHEISMALRDQSYEKTYAEQIKVLIQDVEKDADAFGKIADNPESLIRTSQEAEDLDPETRLVLQKIQEQISHIHKIHSRFTTTISNIQTGFRRFQNDKIGMLGKSMSVPDIGVDFLAKLAMLPTDAICRENGPAEAIAATFFQPRRPSLFDPFVIWETVRHSDEEDEQNTSSDEPTVEITPSKNTSIAEMRKANDFLDKVMSKRGRDGIRLSEIIRIIDVQSKFSRRERFITAHRAAFISQLFRGHKIIKSDDGTRLIDCPYMNGPDLILKVIN